MGRVGEGSGDLGMETVLLSMFINEPKKEMTNKLMKEADGTERLG